MENLKKDKDYVFRPPIVVVLGHVDHGKTTLLDCIRKTSVAQKEKGGITQTIGASVVLLKGGKQITFIDTPGHAAFSNMRSRGAKVADIAILVVASDDGVQPQTREALKYILDADIPFIVAATKIDLISSSVSTIKAQLEKEGIVFEGKGGDIPLIPLSAKTGEGIDSLLEMISLVSELNEIKGSLNAPLEAVVIETGKDKKGLVASIIVRNGKINVGDNILTENVDGKVRGIFDHQGKSVKEVGPGFPAQILGFNNLPLVGSKVWHLEENKGEIIKHENQNIQKSVLSEGQKSIIIKSQNAGTLEAVISNLPPKINIIFSGVGEVNESDIFMAKASSAIILSFKSKIPLSVIKLAETEDVKIESFDIIYELFERVDEIVDEDKQEITGEAIVIASFPFENRRVAGCKVIKGKIIKKDKLIILRNNKEIGKVKIISMKKAKQDINEVGQGEECGILFSPQLDFKISDMILSVAK